MSAHPTTEAACELRHLAVAADAAASLEVSLALVWRELVCGVCQVADGFFTPERCYLVLAASAATTAFPPRRREILEAVLCGAEQKNIAAEQSVAPSTVALNARLGLERLGLHCKASRAHPLLMLTARAGTRHDGTLAATLSFVDVAGQQLRVISLPRPDRNLSRALPPAELEVIRSLVEGLSYDDIARLRQTSTRTIANQMTLAFRRLRVSGRNELIARLFFTEGLERVAPPSWAPAVHATSVRSAASATLRCSA